MNSFFDRTPTLSLPHNFAQNILELEMQMEFEESSTLQVVQQLNELYTVTLHPLSKPSSTTLATKTKENYTISKGNCNYYSHIHTPCKPFKTK